MKPETIKAIFTNLLFVIGIILIIVGFIRGSSTIAKLVVFETYPLESWVETRCLYPEPIPTPEATKTDAISTQDQSQCLKDLELQRRKQLVEDITTSLSTFISGMFLSLLFRRFIFR